MTTGNAQTVLDIDLDRVGNEVRVRARADGDRETAPRSLGKELDVTAIVRFGEMVRRVASNGRPLPDDLVAVAASLQQAVLGGDIGELRARLSETAGSPILVRVGTSDIELQAVPWEALCKSGDPMGCLANSADLLPVRKVISDKRWIPRDVDGAVRLLAISPTPGSSLATLQNALKERIDAGEVEWIDPIEGLAARFPGLLYDRLGRRPHIIHFLGHGGEKDGVPVLRFADVDGEENWIAATTVAQTLEARESDILRLIVLECCEGANPSAIGSAAEILMRAGADAVVAHLWPVDAEVARTFSSHLYRALVSPGPRSGDVASSVNEARRAIISNFNRSAETFSPVLYLRGKSGVLFDFKNRKIQTRTAVEPEPTSPGVDPALARLLQKRFSLLLGDQLEEQQSMLDAFCDKLRAELIEDKIPIPAALPMSSIAQRFALHRGMNELGDEFEELLPDDAVAPPFVENLGRILCPGVHTTLLRYPWLEQAVVTQQSHRTVYVVQPDEAEPKTFRYGANKGWERIDALPATFNPEEDIVLLRLYGGYTPKLKKKAQLAQPLLTEDDYALGLRPLKDLLGDEDMADSIESTLSYRPVLILGLSIYAVQHRMLLHRIYNRGVPRGSMVVVNQGDDERKLWEKGAGLPGKNEGVAVIELPDKHVASLFRGIGVP